MKKKITMLIIISMVLLPVEAFAHSGRTDSSGGHHDNNNVSGLGSYHYHCGGYPPHLHDGGICPYSSSYVGTEESDYSRARSSHDDNYGYSYTPTYPKDIHIESVKKKIYAGDTFCLEASVYPEDVLYDGIKWESSNSKIAKVNAIGGVETFAPGVVTIRAITENDIVTSYRIKVKEVVAKKVEIINPVKKMTVGESRFLQTEVTPANTTYPKVTWKSTKPKIVRISKSGKITACKAGKTKIIAKVGKVSDQFAIEVFPDVKKIIVNKGNNYIKLKKGETYKCKVKVLPKKALNKDVSVSFDGDGVIDVIEKEIIALKPGTSHVTFETYNGIKKTIVVTVYWYTPYYLAGASVVLILIVLAFIIKKRGKKATE